MGLETRRLLDRAEKDLGRRAVLGEAAAAKAEEGGETRNHCSAHGAILRKKTPRPILAPGSQRIANQ